MQSRYALTDLECDPRHSGKVFPVIEGDYISERYTDADALYAFESRGFGGTVGVNYPELWNSDFVYGGTNNG